MLDSSREPDGRVSAPEILLPPEKREAIRARALAQAPRWYNPYVHLAIPSIFALGVIGVDSAVAIPPPLTTRQSDSLNDDWTDRYLRERQSDRQPD